MSYYRICPDCGSHLDPGERCDCQDKKAAPVLQHQSGKVDLISDKDPLPILLMKLEEVKMTLEKIKKLADQVPEEYGLRLGEIQDIYRASKKDSFWMICYAFAYGFHRGQESKENAPA